MNFKKTLLMVTTVSSIAVLAGCGKDLKGYAKLAQRELGIPVQIKTDDTDVCARRQLDRIVGEYRDLSKDERRAIKRFVRKYKSVVVNPSNQTATVTGEVTMLKLVDAAGGTLKKKTLADARKTEGTAPATKLEKAESLSITTENAFDHSVTATYSTQDYQIYKLVTKVDDVLEKSVASGAVTQAGKENSPILQCGETVGLRDLL